MITNNTELDAAIEQLNSLEEEYTELSNLDVIEYDDDELNDYDEEMTCLEDEITALETEIKSYEDTLDDDE